MNGVSIGGESGEDEEEALCERQDEDGAGEAEAGEVEYVEAVDGVWMARDPMVYMMLERGDEVSGGEERVSDK